jgi:Fur family transcriptional regulator, ferric uptake regulator
MEHGAEHARRAYRGRTSRQRDAIAAAADAMDSAFSADDLASAVRGSGEDVGTATIYRAVAAMEEAGYIEAVGTRGGAALYARCRADGHHHHLVCESCGHAEETPCVLDEALGASASGFRVTRHELTIYGVCAECGARAKGR